MQTAESKKMLSQNATKHYLTTLLVLLSRAAYIYSCRQVLGLCFWSKSSDVFLSLKLLNTANHLVWFFQKKCLFLYHMSSRQTPNSQGRHSNSLLIINKALLELQCAASWSILILSRSAYQTAIIPLVETLARFGSGCCPSSVHEDNALAVSSVDYYLFSHQRNSDTAQILHTLCELHRICLHRTFRLFVDLLGNIYKTEKNHIFVSHLMSSLGNTKDLMTTFNRQRPMVVQTKSQEQSNGIQQNRRWEE